MALLQKGGLALRAPLFFVLRVALNSRTVRLELDYLHPRPMSVFSKLILTR